MRVLVNFSPVLLLQKLRPGFDSLLGFLEDCKWLMMLLAGTEQIIDRLFADRSVPGLPTQTRPPSGQSAPSASRCGDLLAAQVHDFHHLLVQCHSPSGT